MGFHTIHRSSRTSGFPSLERSIEAGLHRVDVACDFALLKVAQADEVAGGATIEVSVCYAVLLLGLLALASE